MREAIMPIPCFPLRASRCLLRASLALAVLAAASPVPAWAGANTGGSGAHPANDRSAAENTAGWHRDRLRTWLDAPAEPERSSIDAEALRGHLAYLLREAADRSPQLSRAKAEQDARDFDLKAAERSRWPQVQLSASSPRQALGGAGDAVSRGGAVQLDVVTPLYDFGRTRSLILGRRSLAEGGAHQYQTELEELAFEVGRHLVELSRYRALETIGKTYVDRLDTLVAMLEEIVKVDSGRGSELVQAKARRLQARSQLRAAAARRDEHRLALQRLVGEAPLPRIDALDWTLPVEPVHARLDAANRHPGVLRLQAEAEAAEHSAEATRAAGRPRIDWAIGKTTEKDALGRSPALETRLVLNWNLFSAGAHRADRQAALARADAARWREEALRQELEHTVRLAEREADAYREQADGYRELLRESDRVRKAFFEQWHHLGRRTLLDVLSAESEHFSHQSNEISHRFDGYLALMRGHSGAGTLAHWISAENGRADAMQ